MHQKDLDIEPVTANKLIIAGEELIKKGKSKETCISYLSSIKSYSRMLEIYNVDENQLKVGLKALKRIAPCKEQKHALSIDAESFTKILKTPSDNALHECARQFIIISTLTISRGNEILSLCKQDLAIFEMLNFEKVFSIKLYTKTSRDKYKKKFIICNCPNICVAHMIIKRFKYNDKLFNCDKEDMLTWIRNYLREMLFNHNAINLVTCHSGRHTGVELLYTKCSIEEIKALGDWSLGFLPETLTRYMQLCASRKMNMIIKELCQN